MAQHVGDELQEGAQKAVRETEKAVHTAKAVSKAAAKAAAQDYLGAATEVLRDENLRTTIVAVLLFSFFLTIVIFFLTPLALFETLVQFWDVVTERFAQGFYSGDGNLVESLWNGLVGLFSKETAEDLGLRDFTFGSEDQGESEDAGLFGQEEQVKKIFERKLNAAIDKVTARQNQIANAIKASGVIEATFQQRYESEWAHKYDDDEHTHVEYAGSSCSIIKRKLTKNQALTLLTLHSVQNGTSINNIQLSSFLKWLGYNRNTGKFIDFDLGGPSASIEAWKGTFMPQYLIDEAEAQDVKAMIDESSNKDNNIDLSLFKPEKKTKFQDEYKNKYGCSAIDYLTVVRCPNLYSIQPRVEETVKISYERQITYAAQTYIQYTKRQAMKKGTIVVPYYYIDDDGSLQCGNEYAVWNSGAYIARPLYGNTIYVLRGTHGPYFGGSLRTVYSEQNTYVEIKDTYYRIAYSASVFISLRDVKTITNAAGMWKGWRTFDPEYDVSQAIEKASMQSSEEDDDSDAANIIEVDSKPIDKIDNGKIDDPVPVIDLGR